MTVYNTIFHLRFSSQTVIRLFCSVYCNHKPVISSLITYHQVCSNSNTTGATSGAGTAYLSGASELTLGLCGVCVPRSLVFCDVFCSSLFVLLLLAITLSVRFRFSTFS